MALHTKFVYKITMAGHPRIQIRHLYQLPQLLVLRAARVDLQVWDSQDMAAPFWRLYADPQAGAWVAWQGRRHALAPGRLILISPETPFACGLARSGVAQFYIHFSAGPLWDRVGPAIVSWKASPAERAILRALDLARQRDHAEPQEDLQILTLALQALEHVPASRRPAPLSDAQVRACIRFMGSRLSPPATNEELAREVGLSVNSLLRRFRKATGQSPHQYYLELRLRRACSLLLHTDMSLERIAEACGFCDRYAFTRQFTRRRGWGPAAFRRQHAVIGR